MGATESPPKKARKVDSSKSSTPPKAKEKVASKKNASNDDDIEPEALKLAQSLGLESGLRNLASRADVKASGHSSDAMLKALQNSGGLVNKAKQVLLAGA